MERRGVREWQEDHQPNTFVHDGEAWSLDVAFADGVSCRSRGYAAYPPAGDLEPSQAFIAVLAALSEVAGGRDVGGVRAPLRPTPGQRIAAAQRVEALGQDIGRLEASLPAWRMLARRPGERSVNWMPSGDHGAWPELAALTTAPWPMWDARGMAPTVDGLGVVLVRTLGHPSELVADADGLDLGEQGLAGIIEKLAPSIGVQPTLAWLGTYSDVAVRFCAVVEARRLLGVPVRGVLLGVAGSQEDDSAVAWRAAFAHAWRALELDVLGHDGDALAYAVAEVP
jgi:hypothetical protein